MNEHDFNVSPAIAGPALIMAGLVGLCVALVMWTGAAWAHEAPTGWRYDAACCSNQDCSPIPASSVQERPDGYHVTLSPDQHFMVRADTVFREARPYNHRSIRHSPDGLFHACISRSRQYLICLYVPHGGS